MELMKNKTFQEVYETPDPVTYPTNADYFKYKWSQSGFYSSSYQTMTDDNIKLLYFLILAKYGDTQIVSQEEELFDNKLWSIVFQYGSFWQKEMDIQKEARALDLTQFDTYGNLNPLYAGSKAIYNHSYNPSSTPSTDDTNELPTIDDQNTTKYVKSKAEGLSTLEELLKRDVTDAFLQRFRVLFKKVLPYTKYQITEE